MQLEWQTVVALAIVALTATIFLVRLAKPKSKSKGNCGHDCGCGKKPHQH